MMRALSDEMNAISTAHLDKEMDHAKRIQMRLLNGEPPQFTKEAIAGMSLPARLIGGDYFDYLMVGENTVRVVIGDVMGKGIPAAMLMTMIRGSFRAIAPQAEGPGEVLGKMNDSLCDDLKSLRSFVTFFCADWNMKTQSFTFANAGHNPPLYIKENEILPLKLKGVMIGAIPHQTYHEHTITLGPNEGVLFYTDGITEAQNHYGEQYSKERLHYLLHHIKSFSSREIVNRILFSIAQFTNNQPQSDDITMVMLKH